MDSSDEDRNPKYRKSWSEVVRESSVDGGHNVGPGQKSSDSVGVHLSRMVIPSHLDPKGTYSNEKIIAMLAQSKKTLGYLVSATGPVKTVVNGRRSNPRVA